MRPEKRPTVMVVENYDDTRFLLKYWLEAEGYRVVEAADGREALELTEQECPDLIMMSVRMPVVGGLEAMRRIRARGVDCVFPIVAMSTYPTADEYAAAFAAGCDEFVPMPISLRALSNLVGRLLQGAAGQQMQASA